MINTTSFPVTYIERGTVKHAEIHPCCREDNIVDYAVYQDNKLSFTIAHDTDDKHRWVIAMKNADDDIPDEVVQSIGSAIDNKTTTS